MAHEFMTQLKTWKDQNPLVVWRKQQGLTRKDASIMVGASLNSLANWETGVMIPSHEKMEKLRAALRDPQLAEKWESWLASQPGQSPQETKPLPLLRVNALDLVDDKGNVVRLTLKEGKPVWVTIETPKEKRR